MGHKPYPHKARAAKYAREHGRRFVYVSLAGLLTGDVPPEEAARLHQALTNLPRATMTFTAWFGESL